GGVGGDVGVQADQCFSQMQFDQYLLRLTEKIGGDDVVPAKARDRATRAGEADGKLRRAGGSRAREKVAQMGFDGVGFSKGHFSSASPRILECCCIAVNSRFNTALL